MSRIKARMPTSAIAGRRRPDRMGRRAWLVIASLIVTFSHLGAGRPAEAAGSLFSAGGGTVRAVVIGINDYRRVRSLKGAVADANDISSVLAGAGVDDIVSLVDDQATRQNIVRSFQEVLDRTQKGDLLILSYAGHGSQQTQPEGGSEADGLDETFVLGGFGNWGSQKAERILDDEISAFLVSAAGRGATTLFLADSCHGGGMSKGTEPPAEEESVRGLYRVENSSEATGGGYAYYLADADVAAGLPALDVSDNAVLALPGVTLIGAVEPDALAPEIHIDGEATPRGAASYAFARALQGKADANADGATTRSELLAYLSESIWNHTSRLKRGRQVPVMEPHLGQPLEEVVFRTVAASAELVKPETVSLSTSGPGLAGSPQAQLLESLLAGSSLDLRLEPPRKAYRSGEQVVLVAEDVAGRWISIVDITADGRLLLVSPETGLGEQTLTQRYLHRLDVVPPFGSDTLVLFATESRSPEILTALRALNGQPVAPEVIAELRALLAAGDRVGAVSFTTKPD